MRRNWRRIAMVLVAALSASGVAGPAEGAPAPLGVPASLQTDDAVGLGLDRIDQRTRPLDGKYSYSATGAGVTVYVLSSGIRSDHTEFEGRVVPGLDLIDDGRGTDDCGGWGTQLAGTIGGKTFGVAKQVRLVPIRIIDCNRLFKAFEISKAMDWIVAHRSGPSVIMFDGAGDFRYRPFERAVDTATKAGIPFVVPVGDGAADSCNWSPAMAPDALAVGAIVSRADTRARFSNYGLCLDLFAPGEDIKTATVGGSGVTTVGGTRMAAAHVAGVAALHLQVAPNSSAADIAFIIIQSATTNVLTGDLGPGSRNKLLYSMNAVGPDRPATQPRKAGSR